VTWLRPDGREMTTADWEDGSRQALGMLVPGEANDEVDERGRPIQGETLLLLLNAGTHPAYFRLPVSERPERWVCTLSSARGAPGELRAGALNVRSHSAVLLTLRQEAAPASGAGAPRPPGRWDR
jgi:glycogen operon protein